MQYDPPPISKPIDLSRDGQAIEYIADTYSPDKAGILGSDFVRMKIEQYTKR